jgi:hypothetical protein
VLAWLPRGMWHGVVYWIGKHLLPQHGPGLLHHRGGRSGVASRPRHRRVRA